MRGLREAISREVLRPRLLAEVRELAFWRWRWRWVANRAEALSHALLALATIASFAAGFFQSRFVPLAAGGLIISATALRGFSAYSNRESAERTRTLGGLLAPLGLAAPADLVADPDDRGGEAGEAGALGDAGALGPGLAAPAGVLGGAAPAGVLGGAAPAAPGPFLPGT